MKIKGLKPAFLTTIPVLTGYIFLGMAFGFLLSDSGYSPVWALIMSVFIYAGSMQFVAVSVLVGGFDLLTTAMITLTVNARHIFYGLAMLEKFHKSGRYKPYLIFALTDETFSLLCHVKAPDDVEEKKFYFFISLLNHIYWIVGCCLGALISTLMAFNLEGVEFVMTAFFVVIVVEQWLTMKNHTPTIIGFAISALSLILLGGENFLIPSMLGILAMLVALKSLIVGKGGLEDVS